MLRFDLHDGNLPRPVKRADGSVAYHARIARTGEHVYSWGVEHRDADELASIARQINEAGGAPLTLLHPSGMLASGARGTIVGQVERAWVDGDHVVGELRVDDAGAQQMIADGVRELSLGYNVRVDENGNQKDTKVDHVALVPHGRCGSTCSVRADQACTCGGGKNPRYALDQEKISMDELQKAMSEAAAQKVRADQAEAALAAATKRADTAEGEVETLKSKLAAESKARTDAADEFPARVAARVELARVAERVLGKETDISKLTDREVKVQVVQRLDGANAKPIDSKKSDDFVDGRYTAAIAGLDAEDTAHAAARGTVAAGRADAAGVQFDERAARKAAEERSAKRYIMNGGK